MTALHAGSHGSASPGFVLLEVMMALLLLSILVVPLTEAALATSRRVQQLEDRSTGISEMATEQLAQSDGRPWPGFSIREALWEDGVLKIEANATAHSEPVVVGLWADGWYLGMKNLEEGGVLRLDAEELTSVATALADPAPQELVLRLRVEGEPWGVPFRLLFADAFSPDPLSGSAMGEAPDWELDGVAITHLPATGSIELVYGTEPEIWAGALETLPSQLSLIQGPSRIRVGECTQGFVTRPGRTVNVFF